MRGSMSVRNYFVAMGILSGLHAPAVLAAATEDVDFFQEMPVVLSASRLNQPLDEAPNAMTVIDRKMIVASGFRTIPDLFKLVPGMYVSYYGGGKAIVSYHGATDQYSRRMQVLIDGRSVYMPPASTVDWADLPITLDDIERIEVIRGPAAASHGANSTQGVISITTRSAYSNGGNSVSYTRGSDGVNDVALHAGQIGEKMAYRMTVAYNADTGYADLLAPPNGMPLNQPGASALLLNSYDNNQSRVLNYRGEYHPNDSNSVEMQFGFNHNVQGVGFTDSSYNQPHNLLANASFVNLGWLHQLEGGSELALHYYHSQLNQHENSPYLLGGLRAPDLIAQAVDSARDEIELQHTLELGDVNRLVYGAGIQTNNVAAKQYAQARTLLLGLPPTYESNTKNEKYRVLAHDEWRITPVLLLNTGGMLEKDELGKNSFSPRVALNFHATQYQTLRVGTSVAYRTPAMAEARFPEAMPGVPFSPGVLMVPSNAINSPGLRPEKMVSREIGYLANFPAYGSALDVRLYSDRLTDGILPAGTQFTNKLSADSRGAEVTWKQVISENSDLTLNLAHAWATSNAQALGIASLTPSNRDAYGASIPRDSGSAQYDSRWGVGYAFSANYYFQTGMQPFDRPVQDYQPVQHRTDIRLAKTITSGTHLKGDIALVVQNLFDQRYTEYIANNVHTRRGNITLGLHW